MYRIIFGQSRDAMTHEVTNANEAEARRIYREIAFNRYAALMRSGETIETNVAEGPVVPREAGRNGNDEILV